MDVPPPSILQELFLEKPLPVVIALVAVAVVLRVMASRRRDARLNRVALGAVLLAAVAFLVADFVVTSREAILARSEALVHATAPRDTALLGDALAAGVMLTGPGGQPWLDESELRAQLDRTLERFPIEKHNIRTLAAGARGDRGQSVLDLTTLVKTEFFAGPVRSRWGLSWRRDADGVWRVIEIRFLEFEEREPTQMMWR